MICYILFSLQQFFSSFFFLFRFLLLQFRHGLSWAAPSFLLLHTIPMRQFLKTGVHIFADSNPHPPLYLNHCNVKSILLDCLLQLSLGTLYNTGQWKHRIHSHFWSLVQVILGYHWYLIYYLYVLLSLTTGPYSLPPSFCGSRQFNSMEH